MFAFAYGTIKPIDITVMLPVVVSPTRSTVKDIAGALGRDLTAEINKLSLLSNNDVLSGTNFSEFTYENGLLISKDIWADIANANKLYTISFEYTDTILVKKTAVDVVNSITLTTDFSYNSGILESKIETYS